MTNLKYAATGLIACTLLACKPPEGPPPDMVKTQRDALDKAKGVEGQVKKQAEEQKKTIEEESK